MHLATSLAAQQDLRCVALASYIVLQTSQTHNRTWFFRCKIWPYRLVASLAATVSDIVVTLSHTTDTLLLTVPSSIRVDGGLVISAIPLADSLTFLRPWKPTLLGSNEGHNWDVQDERIVANWQQVANI